MQQVLGGQALADLARDSFEHERSERGPRRKLDLALVAAGEIEEEAALRIPAALDQRALNPCGVRAHDASPVIRSSARNAVAAAGAHERPQPFACSLTVDVRPGDRVKARVPVPLVLVAPWRGAGERIAGAVAARALVPVRAQDRFSRDRRRSPPALARAPQDPRRSDRVRPPAAARPAPPEIVEPVPDQRAAPEARGRDVVQRDRERAGHVATSSSRSSSSAAKAVSRRFAVAKRAWTYDEKLLRIYRDHVLRTSGWSPTSAPPRRPPPAQASRSSARWP